MPTTEYNEYRYKGLKPLPYDGRDYSHAQRFGSVAIDDLPTHDFLVSDPLEIKNQDINYPSDFCASYAASECAEAIDQIIFVPEYTFAGAKWLLRQSGDPDALLEFGLNLRDICEAARKVGFLPRTNDPFQCGTGARPARNVVATFENWPATLQSIAKQYIKPNYFSVLDGPHDTFDNIRAALWMNVIERKEVITGCEWRGSWTNANGGIIPTTYESEGGGHAFAIIGQKTINGEIYLVMESSDGPESGDGGYYYFNRTVVNKEIGMFGAFIFKNTTQNNTQEQVGSISIFQSLGELVSRFITKYIHP